jgi:5-methylcytosine-specific restriction endonuclease McrA
MKAKSSGGAIRSQIMKRDRGICETCKLNCTKLIQRLQAIEKDGEEDREDSWRRRRELLLDTHYPDFASRLSKAQKDGLVEKALSGKAWQADHIVPVFEGGGHCTLTNMRTLCTACHREVTAAQAAQRKKERAALRKQAKESMQNGKECNTSQKAKKPRKRKTENPVEDSYDSSLRENAEDGGPHPIQRILQRARSIQKEILQRRQTRTQLHHQGD